VSIKTGLLLFSLLGSTLIFSSTYSQAEIIKGQSHLSILLVADELIYRIIKE
jgi:hypothetical protein